jgi:hypothetical protein
MLHAANWLGIGGFLGRASARVGTHQCANHNRYLESRPTDSRGAYQIRSDIHSVSITNYNGSIRVVKIGAVETGAAVRT